MFTQDAYHVHDNSLHLLFLGLLYCRKSDNSENHLQRSLVISILQYISVRQNPELFLELLLTFAYPGEQNVADFISSLHRCVIQIFHTMEKQLHEHIKWKHPADNSTEDRYKQDIFAKIDLACSSEQASAISEWIMLMLVERLADLPAMPYCKRGFDSL